MSSEIRILDTLKDTADKRAVELLVMSNSNRDMARCRFLMKVMKKRKSSIQVSSSGNFMDVRHCNVT